MAKATIHTELIELSDHDRAAKKAYVDAFINTQGDEISAMKLSGINPLDLDYLKANDTAFVNTLKSLKAQINGSIGLATKQINELADSMRQTLKSASIYSPLLEPQISSYASIQYDLNQLAKRRASAFYEPISGRSLNPLETLTKARRAELQVVLKALGLSAPSKGLINTATLPDTDPLSNMIL